ncbi:MAG: hypothetical protein LH632_11210 [Rhodoferax sp.]|nr:hypothetical protein [Rhodoferax sp.]
MSRQACRVPYCTDKGVAQDAAQLAVAALNLDVIDLDAPAAHAIAWLRALTRQFGLSLGDRACLALAQAIGAVVFTADRPWVALGETLKLDIRSIPPDGH